MKTIELLVFVSDKDLKHVQDILKELHNKIECRVLVDEKVRQCTEQEIEDYVESLY